MNLKNAITTLSKLEEEREMQRSLCKRTDIKITTNLDGVELLAAFKVPMKFKPKDDAQDLDIQRTLFKVGCRWYTVKTDLVQPRGYLFCNNFFISNADYERTFTESESIFVEVE